MEITAILALLKPFLPLLAPLVVAVLKKFLPTIIEAFPPWVKPIASAVIGAIIAWLSGYVGDPAAAASIPAGVIMGLAGSKARDIVVKKPVAAPFEFNKGGNENQ